MDQGLTTAWIAVLAAAAAVAVALAAAGLVTGRRTARRRRELEQELAASREELRAVRTRLDELDRTLAGPTPEVTGRHRADQADGRAAEAADRPDYVITTAGLPQTPVPGAAATPVSAGRFASLAVGESVVRLVSLGYGVRRALAPESRNRIRFEMGRQVRRSRKERKRELRQARRFLRSSQGGLASEDRVDAA